MKKLKSLRILFLMLFVLGCGGSDESTTDDMVDDGAVDDMVDDTVMEEFDVPSLLADATNSLILPTLSDFNAQAGIFSSLATTYLDETSETNLEALRTQWITMTLAYEKTYVFHIGLARDRFLHPAIYNWPTVAEAIEDFISDGEITEASVAAISPQIKALAGIEYLLFKSTVTETNNEFSLDENRREYLRLSVEFLIAQADRLLSIWQPDGDNYATTFINNEDTGIRASFNLFFNGLNNAVDTGKVTKIGKPGGLETSEIPNPDIVQAPFSNISLELLTVSMEMVEEAFFGEGITNISDYIFFVLQEDSLNDDLQTKIDEVQEAIAAITVPLEEAVTADPTAVENLHTKMTELGILFTVDVRSVLSIIITATDNDGD
ncbi:MAG: imelysin family protein [Bacteroidota bacterium]